MRPTRNREEHGSESLVNSQSALKSLASVEQLWDEWEIHCLVLLSLALQVFLFLAAGIRRRSASRVLHSLLWLAYVSADLVAVFVLGHLAVSGCTSRPRHELMPFWAPFVLVHLGGPSSITAFSMQDNELWGRRLLGLVTQVALAGYVASKSSLSDGRLLAAMVLMFLSGCFKYAERTLCLYLASPAKRRDHSLGSMSFVLQQHRSSRVERRSSSRNPGAAGVDRRGYSSDLTELAGERLRRRFDRMLNAHSGSGPEEKGSLLDIGSDVHPVMSVDAPLNDLSTVVCAESDIIPQLHEQYRRREGRSSKAYGYVAERLVPFYQDLYTKKPLSHLRQRFLLDYACSCSPDAEDHGCMLNNVRCLVTLTLVALLVPVLYFSTLPTPIALAIFVATDKGGGLRAYSRADVVVSYILLAGAVALDVSSAFITFSDCMRETTDGDVNLHLASRTEWSEKLAQYNMFGQHAAAEDDASAAQGTAGSVLRRWIEKPLKACGVQAFDVTRIALPGDLKELVLDKLLDLGAGGQQDWNFASTGGLLALQKWAGNHRDSASARPGTAALHRSIDAAMDFQTSVLIWHMATDICYYEGCTQSSSSPDMKGKKRMCREVSNYIMYLVFKCGVMLKTNSQLLHRKAHGELEEAKKVRNLSGVAHEGNPARMVFQVWKQTGSGMDPLLAFNHLMDELGGRVVMENEELLKAGGGPAEAVALPQGSSGQQPTAHMQLLQSTYEDLDSAVTNRACEVAQELIAIQEDECWELITAVWLEMLFFVAPRCGGAFHSQHLSTGGEFITHVLLLMYFLGPFLPSRSE